MIKIKEATKKDSKKISEIFLCGTKKKPYSMSWTEKSAFKKINELISTGDIFIALLDGKMVGFIAMRTSLAPRGYVSHVEELWLTEKYQGMGIGRKLIEFVEKKYKHKVFALTLGSNKKSKAFGFYKKLGFIAQKGDGVGMRKELK
jgi:ribosomal protein S18 acetylase RimI-like enzyme